MSHEFFVPHLHDKQFVKERRVQKGLFCNIHVYVTVQCEYIYSIVTSTLVRNSHHFRDCDILPQVRLTYS